MATLGTSRAIRRPRLVSRTTSIAEISLRSLEIRARIRLRSVSSLVSPGPRRPTPPVAPPALERPGARRLGEPGQLGERCLGLLGAAVGPHADQHDLFQPELAVLDLGDVGELGGQAGYPAQCRTLP